MIICPWFKLFALQRFDRSWREMGHGPQRRWTQCQGWSRERFERFPVGIADDRNILGNSWWKVEARMVNGGVGATWVYPNSEHIRLLVTSAFASTTARGFSGFFVWTQQSSDIICKKQKSKEGTYRSAAVLWIFFPLCGLFVLLILKVLLQSNRTLTPRFCTVHNPISRMPSSKFSTVFALLSTLTQVFPTFSHIFPEFSQGFPTFFPKTSRFGSGLCGHLRGAAHNSGHTVAKMVGILRRRHRLWGYWVIVRVVTNK